MKISKNDKQLSCIRAYQFREFGFPLWYGTTIGDMLNNLFRDNGLVRVRMSAFIQQHRNPNCLEWTMNTKYNEIEKKLTRSRAEVKTPPAPAHVRSSPGR